MITTDVLITYKNFSINTHEEFKSFMIDKLVESNFWKSSGISNEFARDWLEKGMPDVEDFKLNFRGKIISSKFGI